MMGHCRRWKRRDPSPPGRSPQQMRSEGSRRQCGAKSEDDVPLGTVTTPWVPTFCMGRMRPNVEPVSQIVEL
ncbi:hypothetical protein NDU88_012636 [Pleurodeles waltl]|uniref:Uncharacterized protein n=1 Tax=Pleurodeles waltl TaxID=8319 RepID=A0AAV7R567_PLEWA|nr:hypothetical protein NDU88_012636 [Pleurodeles waltl]